MKMRSSTHLSSAGGGRVEEGDPELGIAPSTPEMLKRGLLGRTVRRIRVGLELTREQFAERYGVPLQDLIDWERGRRAPDEAELANLKDIAAQPDPGTPR